jgi:hypothetical protein
MQGHRVIQCPVPSWFISSLPDNNQGSLHRKNFSRIALQFGNINISAGCYRASFKRTIPGSGAVIDVNIGLFKNLFAPAAEYT